MLLDSNIVIGYLNGDDTVVSTLNKWRESGLLMFVSVITVSEVMSLKSLTKQELSKIEIFLDNFITISIESSIAKLAAELRRTYGVGLPDALIIASAMKYNIPIATRDKKMHSVEDAIFVNI